MYATGQGTGRDPVEAYGWLHRAAAGGIAAAAPYLKRIASRMEPVQLAQAQVFTESVL